METTFGERLQAARKRAGYKSQQALGDVVKVSGRTIRNYEIGKTAPDLVVLEKLIDVLGDFTEEGDPVEIALRGSRLTEDRQYVVLATYKRQLREQDEEAERRRGA
jgi:transcriptional regulator with XRE-family HTH domain